MVVTKTSPDDRLHALEVGTMYKNDEGLSTLIIANNAKAFKGKKRFISIDNDQKHINLSIQMLQKLEPSLLNEIRFYCGHSLEILPKILEELGFIDFALLDGGAHPEVCLREFEIVLDYLSEKGIILVDDLHEIEPSDAYPLQRPFGKGTLILPWLTIADYLKEQNPSDEKLNDSSVSRLLSLLPSKEIVNILGKIDHAVISEDGHKMMIIGNQLAVNAFIKRLSILRMGENTEHIQISKNNGEINNVRNTYDRTIADFGNFISYCLTQQPEEEEFIALWKDVEKLRMRFGLPYMFPGGLGEAQSIDGISGLLSLGDLEAINYCSKQVKGKCVNIGVFEGLSTYFIAKSNREIEVYGIDAYLGMNGKEKKFNYNRFKIANTNLTKLDNAHLIVGLSIDIAKEWKDHIEFLLIDGDHSVEGAISDFKAWSQFVTDGGLIAVHDAYSKINDSFFKLREKDNSHGPDCICQIMAEDSKYEFEMVKGCTEVWRKIK